MNGLRFYICPFLGECLERRTDQLTFTFWASFLFACRACTPSGFLSSLSDAYACNFLFWIPHAKGFIIIFLSLLSPSIDSATFKTSIPPTTSAFLLLCISILSVTGEFSHSRYSCYYHYYYLCVSHRHQPVAGGNFFFQRLGRRRRSGSGRVGVRVTE